MQLLLCSVALFILNIKLWCEAKQLPTVASHPLRSPHHSWFQINCNLPIIKWDWVKCFLACQWTFWVCEVAWGSAVVLSAICLITHHISLDDATEAMRKQKTTLNKLSSWLTLDCEPDKKEDSSGFTSNTVDLNWNEFKAKCT